MTFKKTSEHSKFVIEALEKRMPLYKIHEYLGISEATFNKYFEDERKANTARLESIEIENQFLLQDVMWHRGIYGDTVIDKYGNEVTRYDTTLQIWLDKSRVGSSERHIVEHQGGVTLTSRERLQEALKRAESNAKRDKSRGDGDD